mmetsp:Transcript_24104/g.55668  ORF Transcript_24104/g.55668 Transcript_24104/m.55668 type:complete len:737 (+) Transcript_24104:66-2276(+)
MTAERDEDSQHSASQPSSRASSPDVWKASPLVDEASALDEDALSRQLRVQLRSLEVKVSKEVPEWPQRRGKAVVPEFYFDDFTEELVANLERYFHAVLEVRLDASQKRLVSNTHDYLQEVIAMRNRLAPTARSQDVTCSEEELYIYEPLRHWPKDQQKVMRLIIEERVKQLLKGYRHATRFAEAGVQAGSYQSEDANKSKAKSERDLAKVEFEKKRLEDRLTAMAHNMAGDHQAVIQELTQERDYFKSQWEEERNRANRLVDELVELQTHLEGLDVKLQVTQEETKELEWKRLERESHYASEMKLLEEKVVEAGRRNSARMSPMPTSKGEEERLRRQEEERYKKVQHDTAKYEELERRMQNTIERRVEEAKRKLEEEFRRKLEAELRERDKDAKKRIQAEVTKRVHEEAKKKEDDTMKRKPSSRADIDSRRPSLASVSEGAGPRLGSHELSSWAVRQFGAAGEPGVPMMGRCNTAGSQRGGQRSSRAVFEKLFNDADLKRERHENAEHRKTIEIEKHFLTQLEAKKVEGGGRLNLICRKGDDKMPSSKSCIEDDGLSDDNDEDDSDEGADSLGPASEARKRRVSIAESDGRKKSKGRRKSTKQSMTSSRSLKLRQVMENGEQEATEQPEMEPPTTAGAAAVSQARPKRSLILGGVPNAPGFPWRTLAPEQSVDIGPAVRCVAATSMVPSNISKKATSPQSKRARELKRAQQAAVCAPVLSPSQLGEVRLGRPHTAA